MTRDDIVEVTRSAVGERVRAAVKAVLEQVLEEELTEHVGALRRERTSARTGERNGSYSRDLITPVGKTLGQLKVPRDRDGSFTTQIFQEYHRSTGEVEDAVLSDVAAGHQPKEDSGGNPEAGGSSHRQGRRFAHRPAAGE